MTGEIIEIRIGGENGATLTFPVGTSEEAIEKGIAHFRTTPEFDAIIDKKTGSPLRVRAIVGAAGEQDRLTNLRKFYPDAVAYGDDNFVYTNPATGRVTLHNPSGLDVGDVAGVGKEIAQTVGGGLKGFYVKSYKVNERIEFIVDE